MADKLSIKFVVTPLDKTDIPASLALHESTINALDVFPCSCGVHQAVILQGTNLDYIFTQLVHWSPVPEE